MLVGQAGKVVSGELGDLIQGLDLVLQLQLAAAGAAHRRSWVIFRGGPTIPSCQNSSPSCQNFFLSGGAKFADSVLPC